MRDMTIEQTYGLDETSRTESTTERNDQIIGFDELARIRAEARRLQGATLGRMLGRLFTGKRRATPKREDAMEQAFHRCHQRDAELLRKVGQRAARALGGRAVTGPISDHMLDDIGLTRHNVDGLGTSDLDLYKSSAGSRAA